MIYLLILTPHKLLTGVNEMFDNNFFEKWLDKKSEELIDKLGSGKELSIEEMVILVLKAQSNHFVHLDSDLRGEMLALRKDMDKRFEQVDKRFEQVDKRFERFEKRFDKMTAIFVLGISGLYFPMILDFLKSTR